MNNIPLQQRINAAAKAYLENDKVGAALYAFVKGKKISNVNSVAEVIQATPAEKAHAFIAEIRRVFSEHSDESSKDIFLLLDQLEECINDRKLLVILSGPSAVGKDQIAVNCIDALEELDISARHLLKFGTRQQKTGEKRGYHSKINGRRLDPSARYYFYRSEKQMRADKDLFFLYPKYEHLYGFPMSDLVNPNKPDHVIFVIFGAMNLYASFHSKLRSITTRRIISVLLVANENDLRLRQKNRKYFTDAEKYIRNEEMVTDIKLIHNPKKKIKKLYDLVIENGNNARIKEVQDRIIHEIFGVLDRDS